MDGSAMGTLLDKRNDDSSATSGVVCPYSGMLEWNGCADRCHFFDDLSCNNHTTKQDKQHRVLMSNFQEVRQYKMVDVNAHGACRALNHRNTSRTGIAIVEPVWCPHRPGPIRVM